ncbi:polyprenyl synthetase family protein [Lentzea alba]|uniref:polyprenyl synthetase family protein n=1 Tax=Lentzea alba TaxID=2714351 RepID=UPI0039BEFB6B
MSSLDLRAVRQDVEQALKRFILDRKYDVAGIHVTAPLRALRAFLDGPGKRIRPLFARAGWHTVRDDPDPRLLDLAVGLELFHSYVLIHDDVIDRSDVRRDRPTLHRLIAPDDDWAAVSTAILLGDLCEAWSAELLGGLGAAALEQVHQMREDVLIGQLLDLCGAAEPFEVIHYKTTQYTVHRPLRIGAAMAGADDDVLAACTAYAEPLGEAFQLLDDLEDVIPSRHPRTRVGDLREGKPTVVLKLAIELATPSQRDQLMHLVGDRHLDDDGLRTAQKLIAETGAVSEVRQMIVTRRRQALDVLTDAPFHGTGVEALNVLTDLALPGVSTW